MTSDLSPSSFAKTIRIATRKSPLALWQAEYVKAELERHHPGLCVELLAMSTRGDKILDTPLAKIGGKGLFIKELEYALLDGRADLAVHSMKDVPMEFPEGLKLSIICSRENPYDAFVSNQFASVAALPEGACVGTSSLRRSSQLLAFRPDLQIMDLRGNVNTRLAKLDAGDYDAIILAVAGLKRLQMESRIREQIDPLISLPAPGQGAVGIEIRGDDVELEQLLQPLNDRASSLCIQAERALNMGLQGGCQVPIAAFAQLEAQEQLSLRARVATVDGQEIIEVYGRAAVDEAEALGHDLAKQLLARGADRILTAVYQASGGD